MNRNKRLFLEVSWILLGHSMTLLGSLALVRVLTERLSPIQYGELSLTITIANFVTQVLAGGILAAIARFYSISLEKQDFRGYLETAWQLLKYVSIGLFIVTLILTLIFFTANQKQFLFLFVLVFIYSNISIINSAFNSIQNAARQRNIVAIHSGIDAWLKILFFIFLALWIPPSSTSVIFSYILSIFFITISQSFFMRKFIKSKEFQQPSSYAQDWFKPMWQFSWPIMLSSIFSWGFSASQFWALHLFSKPQDLGKFYALSQVMYSPFLIAGSLIMSFFIPILYKRASNLHDKVEIYKIRSLLLKIVIIGVGLTFVSSLAIFLLKQQIFKLFVAEEYRDISVYAPLVVISAGLLQSSIALGTMLSITNRTKMILPLAMYGQSIVIILNMAATYKYGLSGLIFSMVIGSVLHLAWMLQIIFKEDA